MPSHDNRPVEVCILGELIVRNKGTDVPDLPPALAETVTLLAACCRPVLAWELRSAHSQSPTKDAFNQHIRRLKKVHGIPIASEGPRGATKYQLDPGMCRVDALAFVRGVEARDDIDDLLRLWRGVAPEGVLNASAVKDALSRLIKRIGDLSEADQAALAELPRFATLFPDDRELDQFRRSGPHSKPWLLVVEDNVEMLEEIRGRLGSAYRLKCLASIVDWREFRSDRTTLRLIQGALIDLSLTSDGDDRKGLEIVRYLQDNTEIPAALVTANRMESTEFREAERMEEFRLVDIVSKQSVNWYDALEATAGLLVGKGVGERQRRMETWLNAAYRKVRRETHDAAPGSVPAGRRQRCDQDYVSVLGLVRIGDVDAAQEAVDRFCVTWRTSD